MRRPPVQSNQSGECRATMHERHRPPVAAPGMTTSATWRPAARVEPPALPRETTRHDGRRPAPEPCQLTAPEAQRLHDEAHRTADPDATHATTTSSAHPESDVQAGVWHPGQLTQRRGIPCSRAPHPGKHQDEDCDVHAAMRPQRRATVSLAAASSPSPTAALRPASHRARRHRSGEGDLISPRPSGPSCPARNSRA